MQKKDEIKKKDTASSTKGHRVEGRFFPKGIILYYIILYYIILYYIILYYPCGKIDT